MDFTVSAFTCRGLSVCAIILFQDNIPFFVIRLFNGIIGILLIHQHRLPVLIISGLIQDLLFIVKGAQQGRIAIFVIDRLALRIEVSDFRGIAVSIPDISDIRDLCIAYSALTTGIEVFDHQEVLAFIGTVNLTVSVGAGRGLSVCAIVLFQDNVPFFIIRLFDGIVSVLGVHQHWLAVLIIGSLIQDLLFIVKGPQQGCVAVLVIHRLPFGVIIPGLGGVAVGITDVGHVGKAVSTCGALSVGAKVFHPRCLA